MSYGMAYGANQGKEKNDLVEKNKKARKDAAAKNKAKEDAIRAKQEIPQTKREINKEGRMKKRAGKLVQKKYGKDVLGDPVKFKAAMNKERKGMDKRRERGKQFFIDMARASVGSGDAYSTRERRNNPMSEGGIEGSTNRDFLSELGYKRPGNVGRTIQKTEVKDGSVGDPMGKQSMMMDSGVDKLTQNEFKYDDGTSGLQEDSNPSAFMRKEYIKKKGY